MGHFVTLSRARKSGLADRVIIYDYHVCSTPPLLTKSLNYFFFLLLFYQAILELKGECIPKAEKIRKKLSRSHTLALWMIYIHVVEWRQLPHDIFPGSSENPGRIITEVFHYVMHYEYIVTGWFIRDTLFLMIYVRCMKWCNSTVTYILNTDFIPQK